MEAEWIQVVNEKNMRFIAGKVGVTHWPSSMRPKLIAILCALLMTKADANIVIKTDSLAAINSRNSSI